MNKKLMTEWISTTDDLPCKSYDKCIPYNDETKHLLGTSDEAPEYYRYWEDRL